jgi:hypothetical protein
MSFRHKNDFKKREKNERNPASYSRYIKYPPKWVIFQVLPHKTNTTGPKSREPRRVTVQWGNYYEIVLGWFEGSIVFIGDTTSVPHI